MSAAQILEEIRRLPPNEQDEVVEGVLDEFVDAADKPTPEQIAVFEDRAERLFRNPEIGIPLEQVKAEMKERLKRKRECMK